MAYEDLVHWMFSLERFGIKLGLENMTEFLSRIGNPHRNFKSVHIAGTNGKGSVCAFLASILSENGLEVGLYTSPHLMDFRERIKVNDSMISQEDVVRIGNELRVAMESMADESSEKQLTFFEFTTGLAFRYFDEQRVDIAIVEVGMGGRLDATNLITPEVAGITRVGLEHTAYLGRTLQDIAREKAGIIKDGVPIVTCEDDPEVLSVFENIGNRKGSMLKLKDRDFSFENRRLTADGSVFDYRGSRSLEELRISLMGEHQVENAAMAIALSEELAAKGFEVSDESIRTGLSQTVWRGRLEILSKDPLILLDGSHNPVGVETAVRALARLDLTPLIYVVACMNDKDAAGVIRALSPTAERIIITQVDTKRSMKVAELHSISERFWSRDIIATDNADEALKIAMTIHGKGVAKGVCFIGSLYLVGEVMKLLDKNPDLFAMRGTHNV
ncbi:MAG: bifunctional folylpolyglutamate synthase/dihydrofolate synthase [Methanobacteriota archaeon]|nr:MAG: bifunctional folylpolyglutamate synthase/dihydrofolate synthase [Euryarchaeota archaeon]